jgi:murein DD-endopeptidase MepM/ murein hydrolase activator NlpD
VACAVIALAAVVAPAAAQSSGAPDTGASVPTTTAPRARASTIEEQLRVAYDEAAAEERAALDVYKASLEKTQQLDEQITALDADLVRTAAEVEVARTRLARAQRELADGEQRLREVRRLLAEEKARLDRKAVSAYISGNGRNAQLEVVLGASGLRELESTQAYSAAIVDDQLDSVQKVKRLDAEATALRDRLASAERDVRASRDAIAAKEAQLAATRAEVAGLRDAQAAETARQQELLAAIRAKKQGYLDRLRSLERESDGIASLLRMAQFLQLPVLDPPKLRTPLDRPVKVESPFGMRVHPIFQETRMHTGADLDGAQGDLVRAARAGLVVGASTMDGYGNVVVVDHGDQIATVYAHLSAFDVRFGDRVEAGQPIGRVGSTGYSTGPHLHLELRVSGAPVDPMPQLDVRSCEALLASTSEADQALLRNRTECVPPTTVTLAPSAAPSPRR